MEAKDTVIKPDKLGLAIIKRPKLPMGQAISIEQAEITWKARELEIEEARKAGIKEVVEWISKYRSETTREFIGLTMSREEWRAKLKEWAVEQ